VQQQREPAFVRFLLVLLIAFYLPVLLILGGVIPFAHRYGVLLSIAGALALYAWREGYTLRDLGVRRDTLGKSLAINAGVALVILVAMGLAFAQGLIREPTVPAWRGFFLVYVLAVCPAQEFSCRSLLFAEMNRRGPTSAPLQVGITAITYAFLHTIYWDALTMVVTLVMGVVWGIVYRAAPNFLGVSFSHAVLGVASILMGVV